MCITFYQKKKISNVLRALKTFLLGNLNLSSKIIRINHYIQKKLLSKIQIIIVIMVFIFFNNYPSQNIQGN